MICGVDINEVEDYVIKGDVNSPTIWKIGVLDSITTAMVDDITTTFEMPELISTQPKTTLNLKMKNIEVVRYGLRGFTNFKDKTGNDIVYKVKEVARGGKKYSIVADEIMAIIPANVINELADVITKKNVLSETEIKN